MSGHFQRLLSAAVADPARRVSELPLLTSEEQEQLLVDWNQDAGRESRAPACLHQLFAVQARRTPDALAVGMPPDGLTYAELDRVQDRLARRLAALGPGPEVPFGVLMDRSLDLVAALLAILKAGAVYLPLDPAYPARRLILMLEDFRRPALVDPPPADRVVRWRAASGRAPDFPRRRGGGARRGARA